MSEKRTERSQEIVIPVVEENVRIERDKVGTATVKVRKIPEVEPAHVTASVLTERVEVQRVAIGRPVDSVPQTRQQGDTTIIPVVEEVIEIRKHLVLKEEIHVRKVKEEQQQTIDVPLMKEKVVIDRIRAHEPLKEESMQQNIIGVFDNEHEAELAVNELQSLGVGPNDIQMMDYNKSKTIGSDDMSGPATGKKQSGFRRWLSDLGLSNDDPDVFAESVRRGCLMISVSADDNKLDQISNIFYRHGAVDIDKRAEYYKSSGFKGYDDTLPAFSRDEMIAERERFSPGGQFAVPVVEEKLNIGKRQVNRGGIRVVTHVVEKPVEADIELREEHVTVDRERVDRPLNANDLDAFQEQTLEMTETAEVPIVSKEARVVEEVRLGKESSTRTEHVRDTVRRREVDIERTNTGQIETSGYDAGQTDLDTNLDPSLRGSSSLENLERPRR